MFAVSLKKMFKWLKGHKESQIAFLIDLMNRAYTNKFYEMLLEEPPERPYMLFDENPDVPGGIEMWNVDPLGNRIM